MAEEFHNVARNIFVERVIPVISQYPPRDDVRDKGNGTLNQEITTNIAVACAVGGPQCNGMDHDE